MSEAGEKLRAAIYTRVSTRDKGQTVENQLPTLREFANLHGYQIVKEYEDHETGSKPTREGFQAMLKDAHHYAFDVLLFWSLDRFSREGAYETLDYLRDLDGHKVRFRSYTEQYLDTCGIFREAIIALLAVLAKQERLRLSERVKAGMARAKAEGRKVGRKPVGIDMERFRRLDAVYTTEEIMRVLSVARTTVYKYRTLMRKQSAAQVDAVQEVKA